MAKKLVLKSVRLSFPSLFATEKYNGTDTGKFAATFLIPKDDKQAKEIQKAVVSAAEEHFGKPVPKAVKYCLGDGDEKEYDGYADHWSIKATTKRRPIVIDRDKTPLVEEDGKPYAGCFVNASIEIWVMDNQYGKRVLAALNGVQFNKDGEAFGSGASSAMDDFDELESDDDDSDNPFA